MAPTRCAGGSTGSCGRRQGCPPVLHLTGSRDQLRPIGRGYSGLLQLQPAGANRFSMGVPVPSKGPFCPNGQAQVTAAGGSRAAQTGGRLPPSRCEARSAAKPGFGAHPAHRAPNAGCGGPSGEVGPSPCCAARRTGQGFRRGGTVALGPQGADERQGRIAGRPRLEGLRQPHPGIDHLSCFEGRPGLAVVAQATAFVSLLALPCQGFS